MKNQKITSNETEVSTEIEVTSGTTITIRDVAIAPYEIDVDKHNFTVVKVIHNEETGKMQRKPLGYYGGLTLAINKILREKVAAVYDKSTIKGCVVTLSEFIEEQKIMSAKAGALYDYLQASITLPAKPTVTPKRVLDKVVKKA